MDYTEKYHLPQWVEEDRIQKIVVYLYAATTDTDGSTCIAHPKEGMRTIDIEGIISTYEFHASVGTKFMHEIKEKPPRPKPWGSC